MGTFVSGSFYEAIHHLSKSHHHFSFSSKHPPAICVRPGELIHVETWDCFRGALFSSPEEEAEVDETTLNPVTGPIYVEGAKPGDTLSVRIHRIHPHRRGAAHCCPTAGQLSHLICKEYIRYFDITETTVTMQGTEISFPCRPMLGVIGVAPAEGEVGTMPAGKHGGNLDNKMNQAGNTLHLKVQHEGALLSIGDMHAAQGDGEICGTGVEVGGDVLLSCHIISSEQNATSEFPVTETATHWAVHGVTVEDIPGATTVACEGAAKLLMEQWGFKAEDAYIFLSVAGDLGLCQACHPDKGTQIAKMAVPKIAACPSPFKCQSLTRPEAN